MVKAKGMFVKHEAKQPHNWLTADNMQLREKIMFRLLHNFTNYVIQISHRNIVTVFFLREQFSDVKRSSDFKITKRCLWTLGGVFFF